jgi:hypothetical protein
VLLSIFNQLGNVTSLVIVYVNSFTKLLLANKMLQFFKHVSLVDIKDKIIIKEGQIEELLN